MVNKHNDSIDLAVGPTLTYGKKSGFSDISTPDLGVHLSHELCKSALRFCSHPFLSVTVTALEMAVGGDKEHDKERRGKR